MPPRISLRPYCHTNLLPAGQFNSLGLGRQIPDRLHGISVARLQAQVRQMGARMFPLSRTTEPLGPVVLQVLGGGFDPRLSWYLQFLASPRRRGADPLEGNGTPSIADWAIGAPPLRVPSGVIRPLPSQGGASGSGDPGRLRNQSPGVRFPLAPPVAAAYLNWTRGPDCYFRGLRV